MKTICAVAVSAVLFAGAVQAATITNNETNSQTIRILSENAEQSYMLNPSDSITVDENFCAGGCVLALPSGEEFEIVKTDDLVLEQGGVYINPSQQGAAGETEQPRQ